MFPILPSVVPAGIWFAFAIFSIGYLFSFYTGYLSSYVRKCSKEETGRFHVAIIGSGCGGISMAYYLQKANIPFTIYELDDDVGGTWKKNTYPDCACDVPSHLYSFSFCPNPNWTHKFPVQEQILNYIRLVVKKYGIDKNIVFNSKVEKIEWDSKTETWQLTILDTSTLQKDDAVAVRRHVSHNIVVTAMGQLNIPKKPSFPNLDSFQGISFHSQHWRHDVDYRNKRVGVIGNGPSATQFLGSLLRSGVKSLTIFQRSAPFILKKPDFEYPGWAKNLFRHVPIISTIYRLKLFLEGELLYASFFKNSFLNKILKKQMDQMREEWCRDAKTPPLVQEHATPVDVFGCKRVVLSTDYFDVLSNERSTLVTGSVEKVLPDGIRMVDSTEYPLDVMIYGTGFETQKFLFPMEIRGRGGVELQERWKDTPRAYYSMCVPGFPNFFMLYGPGSNLGHNSIILMMEVQALYIARLLSTHLLRNKMRVVEVTESATEHYIDAYKERVSKLVWTASCNSWYKNKDGVVTNNLAWSCIEYLWKMRFPNPMHYQFSA
tara:strand:+ start:210 stop:1847 length:1638 start_codon:yes stop_codon:yes gene_type:complete